MIVEDETIVVVNTSSCNMQTAKGIMRRDPRYMMHRKWQLNLSAASPELNRLCRIDLQDRESNWRARLAQQMEDLHEGRRSASKGAEAGAETLGVRLFQSDFHAWITVLVVSVWRQVICWCVSFYRTVWSIFSV